MSRAAWLLLGVLLLAAAWLVAGPRRSVARVGRDLARPVVLPVLWRSLESARESGTVEEYVAKGRVLMELIPEWADGHIHLAGRLAFDASLQQPTPEAALDRLLAAVRLLDEACATRPGHPDEFLTTAAQFVTIRCDQDPALARAFRDRVGKTPSDFAEAQLRRVPQLRDKPFVQQELVFYLIGGLADDIDKTDPSWLPRVKLRLASAQARLDAIESPSLREAWRKSLANLDRYLRGDDDISLSDLENDPRLRKIHRALTR